MARYQSILVVSDNPVVVGTFIDLLQTDKSLTQDRTFSFACHYENEAMKETQVGEYTINSLNVKAEHQQIVDNFDLIISAHCKQIFPPELVSERKCINIHPGYNPFNRGWYPQVFSILNDKPLGATIHEIDEELDHGKIIAREKVELRASDTSLSAYNRVQEMEDQMLKEHLAAILDDTYTTFVPEEEGNLNLKKDFNDLQELDLDEQVTFQQALDRLRALTHPPYKNAHFTDPKTGKRVWVSVELEEEA